MSRYLLGLEVACPAPTVFRTATGTGNEVKIFCALARAKSEALVNKLLSKVYSNKIILSGDGNENSQKNQRSNYQKNNNNNNNNFARAAHFFCTFLCRCYARVQRENGENFVKVPVHFFSYRSFSPWWPLAFLIFLTAAKKFHVFLPNKLISYVFISRSSFFSVIHFNVDVVVNFLSRVIFIFLLFLGMLMYANEV